MEKPHSRLGLASCVIAIGMFVPFVLALAAHALEWTSGSELLTLAQVVVLMMLPVPVHVVGLVLGAVSSFFPARRKLFPVLGLALNALFALCGLFPWLWLIFHSMGRVQ